jgi:hypothetical protein
MQFRDGHGAAAYQKIYRRADLTLQVDLAVAILVELLKEGALQI